MKFAYASVLSAAAAVLLFGAFGRTAHAAAPIENQMPSLDEAAQALSIADASADAPMKPSACETYHPDPKSKLIGDWSLKQRDDGQDWSGPWDIQFKEDGSWSQVDGDGGYWCQSDDMIFFGFQDDPHTTYRGELSGNKAEGTESWNGGGTGIFEIKRATK